MSGENLIDAQPSIQNQNNEPTVSFTLDRLEHKNLEEQLLIMLEKD
jgi:preprotein translocase subunit SecD